MTTEERKAYALGRTDAHCGERSNVAEMSDGEAEAYKRGYRHTCAEERLNADTDWD